MEHSYTIQKAEEHHLKQITENICKMSLETEKYQANSELVYQSLKEIFQNRIYGLFYVALEKDQVIASLIVTFEFNFIQNAMIYWIQSLYVLPDYRKRGIFTSMYKHIYNDAKSEGVRSIKLYVAATNQVGIKVYERLEMTPVEEVFYNMNFLEAEVSKFKALLEECLKSTLYSFAKLSSEDLKTLKSGGCKSILNDYPNYESVLLGVEASLKPDQACEIWALRNEKKDIVGVLSAFLEVDDWNSNVMYTVNEILVFTESDDESLLAIVKLLLAFYMSEAAQRNPSELRVKFNRNKASIRSVLEGLTFSSMSYLFYEQLI